MIPFSSQRPQSKKNYRGASLVRTDANETLLANVKLLDTSPPQTKSKTRWHDAFENSSGKAFAGPQPTLQGGSFVVHPLWGAPKKQRRQRVPDTPTRPPTAASRPAASVPPCTRNCKGMASHGGRFLSQSVNGTTKTLTDFFQVLKCRVRKQCFQSDPRESDMLQKLSVFTLTGEGARPWKSGRNPKQPRRTLVPFSNERPGLERKDRRAQYAGSTGYAYAT